MSPIGLESRDLNWRTARRSAGNGACVEVAAANLHVHVRDSKDPEGSVLSYPVDAFRTFLDSAKRAVSW